MRSIKKYGLRGVAVSVVLVAALALLLGTSQRAQAELPTIVHVDLFQGDVNVGGITTTNIFVADTIPSIVQPTDKGGPKTVYVRVDVDDGATPKDTTDNGIRTTLTPS